jgi:hypothetical protein
VRRARPVGWQQSTTVEPSQISFWLDAEDNKKAPDLAAKCFI